MSAPLASLREGLLYLHKTLLDWERSRYEQIHGRKSNTDLLNAVFQDPQFSWLRPMSQLIVRIDEILEAKTPPETKDLLEVLAKLDALASPGETGDEYARRYHAALQENAAVASARGSLVTLLGRDR